MADITKDYTVATEDIDNGTILYWRLINATGAVALASVNDFNGRSGAHTCVNSDTTKIETISIKIKERYGVQNQRNVKLQVSLLADFSVVLDDFAIAIKDGLTPSGVSVDSLSWNVDEVTSGGEATYSYTTSNAISVVSHYGFVGETVTTNTQRPPDAGGTVTWTLPAAADKVGRVTVEAFGPDGSGGTVTVSLSADIDVVVPLTEGYSVAAPEYMEEDDTNYSVSVTATNVENPEAVVLDWKIFTATGADATTADFHAVSGTVGFTAEGAGSFNIRPKADYTTERDGNGVGSDVTTFGENWIVRVGFGDNWQDWDTFRLRDTSINTLLFSGVNNAAPDGMTGNTTFFYGFNTPGDYLSGQATSLKEDQYGIFIFNAFNAVSYNEQMELGYQMPWSIVSSQTTAADADWEWSIDNQTWYSNASATTKLTSPAIEGSAGVLHRQSLLYIKHITNSANKIRINFAGSTTYYFDIYFSATATTPVTPPPTVTPPPVTPTPATPVINHFYWEPASILVGQSNTLHWDVTGATSVVLSGDTGTYTLGPSGEWENGPYLGAGSFSTTLTAFTAGADPTTVTATAPITVTEPTPVINYFYWSPASILVGQSNTLHWDVTGATSVVLSGDTGTYTLGASGTLVNGPYLGEGEFSTTLSAFKAGADPATVTATAPITVTEPAAAPVVALGAAYSLSANWEYINSENLPAGWYPTGYYETTIFVSDDGKIRNINFAAGGSTSNDISTWLPAGEVASDYQWKAEVSTTTGATLQQLGVSNTYLNWNQWYNLSTHAGWITFSKQAGDSSTSTTTLTISMRVIADTSRSASDSTSINFVSTGVTPTVTPTPPAVTPTPPAVTPTPPAVTPTVAGGGGCFVAGTLITLHDFTLKPIEQLAPDTRVWGQNGVINTVITNTTLSGTRAIYTINNQIEVTGTHPILTSEGWAAIEVERSRNLHPTLEIKELVAGDRWIRIRRNGDEFEEIVQDIVEDTRDVLVYSLNVSGEDTPEIDGNDTYVANGVIVHNKLTNAN